MNFMQSVSLAWDGIMSNKLRSFLTMLGMIIGVGAVIGLVSIGQGATSEVKSQLESLGSNLIMIMPIRDGSLKAEHADELLERVPTIASAAPVVMMSVDSLKAGSRTYDPSMPSQGVTDSFDEVRNFQVAYGRFISDADVSSRAKVAVLGQKVAEGLFPNSNPLGQSIYLNGQMFTVVGVMASKGASMGQDNDEIVFIPLSVAQRMNGSMNVNTIYVQSVDGESAPLAVNHITSIFQLKSNRSDGELPVYITSQDELLGTINSMTQTLSLMLGAIAGISLLVGGIGIMNIMLVSVTERTREIGILKAIGAKKRQILSQFLVESVVISLTGGVIGIVFGGGASMLLGKLLGFTAEISLPVVVGSFAFAAMIGLFFGVYPAMKAANLNPIEALRHS